MDAKASSTQPATGGGDARSLGGDSRVLDITVLMGGPSLERPVSLMSGEQIAGGLLEAGHHVTCADISPAETSALDREGIDVVFIALHGAFGESGEVQQLCERRGLRYIGSGPRASRQAMDKVVAKEIFRRAGLATPAWIAVEESQGPQSARQIDPPVVCKPIDGGSSVDITIARTAEQRDAAVSRLLGRYGRAMVEQFIDGPELTVGILGQQILPALRIIVPDGGFYDYEAKYAETAKTQYLFDHGVGADVEAAARRAAMTAHEALGCRDLSRVDMVIDAAGVPQVIEVNTIPGFTRHSLLPKAAERAGISFAQLVDRIARMAMDRPAGGSV